MRIRMILAAALIIFVLVGCGKQEEPAPVMTFELPEGDAVAGRQAFVDLLCTTCHRVAGDADLPRPVSAYPGPELGAKHAAMTPGALATSIINPTLHFDEEYTVSPMVDFSERITVPELIDLVTYLRAVEEGS